MTEHITSREFGTILADFVFLPDDNFEEQAAELIRVLKAEGFEIVREMIETPGGGRENSPVRGASNPDSRAPIAKMEGKMMQACSRNPYDQFLSERAEHERLRAYANREITALYEVCATKDAEIERLQEENEVLRAQLDHLVISNLVEGKL